MSGKDGFTAVITYSIHCNGSCSGACDGFACPTGECIRTKVSYVYTGVEDTGSGFNGNPTDGGLPPGGGAGGNDSGIYIPNPYEGDADPNNADFMLAGQVAAFTSTLAPNLQALIANNPFIYPYLVDFCRNNGADLSSQNRQKITQALTNFNNFLVNFNNSNLTTISTNRFKLWAFYTFLNNNPLEANTTKVNAIKNFIEDPEFDTANAIIDYLYENIEDEEALTQTIQQFNSAENNNGYTGDGFLFDNDDENDDYVGSKSLIPAVLVLDDGSTVNVEFGTTASDNQSANKLVADDLINSLKFALKEANLNLDESSKITTIYIKATTNGSHSATSNHSKGTAIDISRVNGVLINNLGANNQVQELQEAFDSYPNIRENFGPAFKHKTQSNGTRNNNFQISGHRDHIHVSVQSN